MARRAAAAAVVAVLVAGLFSVTATSASPVPEIVPKPAADEPRAGLPRGVAPAARRDEPNLPEPQAWPFAEAFPRTSGTGRVKSGALLWTDFLYDDNGAVSGPGVGESAGAWPFGTYRYPDENQAGNGADIFRVGVAVDVKNPTATWWRVDWNTLLDPSVPAAAFAIDRDGSGGAAAAWGGNVGVTSAGVDSTLVITSAGAFLDGERVSRTIVDGDSKSFIARVPTTVFEARGRSVVWLAAGLANETGDAFASLGPEHQQLPGQPNVFNMGFRDYVDEPADKNFWFEQTQATTLAEPQADVTRFGHRVNWDRLRSGRSVAAPLVRGWSNRWYVSSIELGQGRVRDVQANVDNEPNYLGRVQPYGVYVPQSYDPAAPAALTWLLHSLTINHTQYGATMPDLLRLACEERGSICATTLGRGPDGYYRQEAELDFWEVWAALNRSYALDRDRTIIGGFSMGGFGTFNIALDHPDAFAGMVILASAANEDEPRLGNAKWLPYYHAHGLLDELVPYAEEAEPTIEKLDRLGYRYRFDTYPTKDHIAWSLEDGNDLAGEWIAEADRTRRRHPGEIIYRWFPREVNRRWGIGPTGAWWIRGLDAREDGPSARVRARSLARPERPATPVRSQTPLVDSNGSPVIRRQLVWERGGRPDPRPRATLNLDNVRTVSLNMPGTGLLRFGASVIDVTTDGRTTIRLRNLPPGVTVRVDGQPTDRTPDVRRGDHRIRLEGER